MGHVYSVAGIFVQGHIPVMCNVCVDVSNSVWYPLLVSKLLEGYVKQNILQDQTSFCHENTMALSDLREIVYLPKLYLPQMAPLDVQRVTDSAKWLGTQFRCRNTFLPMMIGEEHKLCSPLPPVWWGKCGLGVVGN